MKGEEENELNEIWESPEVTVLNVNGNTEAGANAGEDGIEQS